MHYKISKLKCKPYFMLLKKVIQCKNLLIYT